MLSEVVTYVVRDRQPPNLASVFPVPLHPSMPLLALLQHYITILHGRDISLFLS